MGGKGGGGKGGGGKGGRGQEGGGGARVEGMLKSRSTSKGNGRVTITD